jgi:hypothetical protein
VGAAFREADAITMRPRGRIVNHKGHILMYGDGQEPQLLKYRQSNNVGPCQGLQTRPRSL